MEFRRPNPHREEYGIVLDFLQHGRGMSLERGAIAQVLGEKYLVLLEIVPRRDVSIVPGERIYLGPDKREKVHHIAGRIPYSKLTQTAKGELDDLIEKIVNEREKEFVEFFNKCGPISTRLHTLEIIPGIGKKLMWDIINERKVKPFESFEDMRRRVKLIPDPKQSVIKRILEELEENDKYRLFVG
jgi:putative nucleotide binding protein